MPNYEAFENDDGDALRRVQRICRHLTENGLFTESSPVTAAEVEQALDDGYYFVCGELARNNYGTTATDAKVLGILCQIQALDAACQVEFSMPVTDTGEPNDRYKSLAARRDRLIADYLRTDALHALGATRAQPYSLNLEMTGRSEARKREVYGDTDVPPSRFPRGFGQRRDIAAATGRVTGTGGSDPSL